MRQAAGFDGEAFTPMFPTPTRGDGMVRANNARPGGRQPGSPASQRRKLPCTNCGFLCDLSRQAPSGGDLTGDGGITVSTTGSGASLAPDSTVAAGAACPFCGSKNFAPAPRGA